MHNPDANPAIETLHVLDEPLCLVSAAKGAARKQAPLPLAELVKLPLVLPEHTHAIRKLLETQAALAGLKLNIAYEVSSVSSILELVRSGHGHAVLTPSAVAASGQAAAFRVRPLAERVLTSTLCLASLGAQAGHAAGQAGRCACCASWCRPASQPARAHNRMR